METAPTAPLAVAYTGGLISGAVPPVPCRRVWTIARDAPVPNPDIVASTLAPLGALSPNFIPPLGPVESALTTMLASNHHDLMSVKNDSCGGPVAPVAVRFIWVGTRAAYIVKPAAPAGPVAPVTPWDPWGPVGPVAPVTPCVPWGPVGPVAPVTPWTPCVPCAPVGPVIPICGAYHPVAPLLMNGCPPYPAPHPPPRPPPPLTPHKLTPPSHPPP